MLFADEVARRDQQSAQRRARAAHPDPQMQPQDWDDTATVTFDATPYEIEEREVAIDERPGGGTTIVYDIHIPFRGHLVWCTASPTGYPRNFVHGEATESTIALSYAGMTCLPIRLFVVLAEPVPDVFVPA